MNELERLMMHADMARKEARLNGMADPPPLCPYCGDELVVRAVNPGLPPSLLCSRCTQDRSEK